MGDQLVRTARSGRCGWCDPVRDLSHLHECPHLARIVELQLDPTFAEHSRQIGLLLHSRQLPSLRSLQCTLNGADGESLALVGDAPMLQQLHTLSLPNTDLSMGASVELFGACNLTQLHRLEITERTQR